LIVFDERDIPSNTPDEMLEFPSSTIGFRSREESGAFCLGRYDKFFVLKIREELDLLKVGNDEEDESVRGEGDDSISVSRRIVEASLGSPELNEDGQRSNERVKVAVRVE